MSLDLLDTLTQPQTLPLLAAIVLVLVVTIGISALSGPAATSRRRLRQLQELRHEGMPDGRFHATHKTHVKDDDLDELGEEPEVPAALDAASSVVASLPLLGQKDRDKIRALLDRAGIRRSDAMGLYIGAKFLAYGLGVMAALSVINILGFPEATIFRFALVLGGAVVAGIMPEFVVNRMIERRAKNIDSALPDALDLMVICTESGLSLDPTIERVAREMRLSSPPLARELAIVSHEMRLLPSREEALLNFAERNASKSVRSLVTTLVQTMKYGTSLAHSLRVLANESRTQRMLAVEEKAARLPAMMSLPLVCCMLPAVFLIIAGPAVSQVMGI